MIRPAEVTDHTEGPVGIPLDDFSPLHTVLPYVCTEGIGFHPPPHYSSLLSLNCSTSSAKLCFSLMVLYRVPQNPSHMAVTVLFHSHLAKAGLHGSILELPVHASKLWVVTQLSLSIEHGIRAHDTYCSWEEQ